MEKIAEKIKQLREDRKLKQKELAEALGIDRTLISKYESGTFNPPIFMLAKMAKLFNVSTDYFFYELKETADKVNDKELFELVKKADKLGVENRKTLKNVIKGLILKDKKEKSKKIYDRSHPRK